MYELNKATTESMRSLLTQKLRVNKSGGSSALRSDLFDEADIIVMASLRRDYWRKFLASPEYTKLKNFLWYQDRRVVPDDFFVMRVLGRGGFGLVTGES